MQDFQSGPFPLTAIRPKNRGILTLSFIVFFVEKNCCSAENCKNAEFLKTTKTDDNSSAFLKVFVHSQKTLQHLLGKDLATFSIKEGLVTSAMAHSSLGHV